MSATPAQTQMTAQQQNALARQIILANSIERIQSIYNGTSNAANANLVQVTPQNVGLLRGFFVNITATVNNTGGVTATLTLFGAANILDNIQFQDLQNQTRINTSGWHMHFLNTLRQGTPYGLAFGMQANEPVAYGNNWNVISAPATIATGTSATVVMRYYVPLAYGKNDLRGAVFANVVSSTMALQLSINTAAFAATGDATKAVYSGSAGNVSNVTVEVLQHYLDQIPMTSNGGVVLPMQDLSTIYDIKSASLGGMSVGNDFGIPYANLRDFLSTIVVYDNGGTLNAGTDLNSIALQSANQTTFWRYSPQEAALLARVKIGVDFPVGVYAMESRDKPISTIQTGNTQLVLNASVVNANAIALLGYEAFSYMNLVSSAGSLPSGG